MAEFPNPLNLVPGRNGGASDDAGRGADEVGVPARGSVVRSRVGSPNVLVSLPFSQIEIHEGDPGIGEDVVELATLTSELASAVAAVLVGDEVPALMRHLPRRQRSSTHRTSPRH